MKPIRLVLAILFFLSPGFLRAQTDTLKLISGHTYLLLTNTNIEYIVRLLSQSGDELMVAERKGGMMTLSKKELKKALDIGQDGAKVKRGEPGRDEISIGYGYRSINERDNETLGYGSYIKYHRTIVMLSYSYWFKDIESLGLDVCEDNQWGANTGSYYLGKTENNLTIAARSIFNYTFKAKEGAMSKVKLFGSGAVGVCFNEVERRNSARNVYGWEKHVDKAVFTSYHISPIGIRMGGMVALYVELGYGYRGLINASLSYRPRPKLSGLPTFRE